MVFQITKTCFGPHKYEQKHVLRPKTLYFEPQIMIFGPQKYEKTFENYCKFENFWLNNKYLTYLLIYYKLLLKIL